MPVAIYPGSFDPLTNGHLSIIHRSLEMFEKVVVAIAVNPKKTPLFTVDERLQLIRDAVQSDRIEVDHFQNLLVDYAGRRRVKVIMRGLRAVSDFEYEFMMANMNRKLAEDIETVFMMTSGDHFYISSQNIREVSSLGGSVEGMVPPNVLTKLREKFQKK